MITTPFSGRSKEEGTGFWIFITLAAGWALLWILGLTAPLWKRRMTLVCLTCRKKFESQDKKTAFKSHIMNHKGVPEIDVE
ncbi:MAG TPA: hypothetical protein VE843_01715 [Ktedonobacteraceae bacterium]|nr:hypothetical protein [Ktedonobacteraceae bacterium]